MLLAQFSLTFHDILNEIPCFIALCSHADWYDLPDHLTDFPWEDIFKLRASATAIEFCEWIQVEIDVYISLIERIRSSLTHLHGFQLLPLVLKG